MAGIITAEFGVYWKSRRPRVWTKYDSITDCSIINNTLVLTPLDRPSYIRCQRQIRTSLTGGSIARGLGTECRTETKHEYTSQPPFRSHIFADSSERMRSRRGHFDKTVIRLIQEKQMSHVALHMIRPGQLTAHVIHCRLNSTCEDQPCRQLPQPPRPPIRP